MKRFFGVLLLAVAPLCAGPILSGSVSYDAVTHVYTYTYSIDNTAGPAPIAEIGIVVDPGNNNQPSTPAFLVPAGWTVYSAVTGSVSLPPINEFGGAWAFHDSTTTSGSQPHNPVPVGSTLSGFIFRTSAAPVAGNANNYFLVGEGYSGGPPQIGNGSIVEWGHVVAPDLKGSSGSIPEPSTFAMLLLPMIAFARRLFR